VNEWNRDIEEGEEDKIGCRGTETDKQRDGKRGSQTNTLMIC